MAPRRWFCTVAVLACAHTAAGAPFSAFASAEGRAAQVNAAPQSQAAAVPQNVKRYLNRKMQIQGPGALGAPKPVPAIALFSPHKTGSSFFVRFLRLITIVLQNCFYSENAVFMYNPLDNSKCSSKKCGYETGPERVYGLVANAGSFGQCTTFMNNILPEAATKCTSKNFTRKECPMSGQVGFVWGPTRVEDAMRATTLLAQTQKYWHWHIILHQRHPWDALVSSYHSYGWTHEQPVNATSEQVSFFSGFQAFVRNKTIDQFVIAGAETSLGIYAPYIELMKQPPPGVVIIRSRYEDMVRFYAQWLSQLIAQFESVFTREQRKRIYARLLPEGRAFSTDGQHRRTVTPGAYTRELQPETITKLEKDYRELLVDLGYV